ncbi:MAG: short-chain dehydrogenase [Alphaproteobacteria bacterium CG11_big_fil_rev_8_21_14_0_20_44_7]|nr:MAG: short-chain dehydrogenase [Alphaproteobacteria bacterium CG11_big_fil_rev_8_21_14_0_20_44_7]
MKDLNGKNIWLIGASSGIGEALAKELAMQGANLALSARREKELDKVKKSLQGNKNISLPLDVSNLDELKKAASKLKNDWGQIDSVITLAAIYYPEKIQKLEAEKTAKLIEINLTSNFYLCEAVLPILTKQKEGQIVFCGSVAGYVGLPKGQPYCATKAGVISLAESLKIELAEDHPKIDVKVICPGFVKTPMTDKNNFKMPMVIEAEEAAKAIAKGLKSKKFEIHFPRKFTNIMKLLEIMPYRLYFWLSKKLI